MMAYQTIGNYRIEQPLGSGGMADVYLATHMLLKKKFAIKVLKTELGAKNPLMFKRFVREAQIAQQIDHPNIVKVYDVGNDPNTGQLFIVMEYVEGENLYEYSRGKHLPSQRVREIAYEMSKALMELHRQGIVHRDIKPSNIMLCKDGTIKLMDLGIAKAVHNGTEGEATLTMDQAVLGTPAFSSPEQCRDAKSVDIRSDIYCLGASLYAIATGEIPYGGTTAMEILLKVLEEKPKPLAEIRPDLDADLIYLIESMMEKNPDKRPQTPQDLLMRLVSRTMYHRWMKKAIGAGIAVCILIVAAISWKLMSNGAAHQEPDSHVQEKSKAIVAKTEKALSPLPKQQPAVTPQKKPNPDDVPQDKKEAARAKEQASSDNVSATQLLNAVNQILNDVSGEDLKKGGTSGQESGISIERTEFTPHITLKERLSDVEKKLANDGIKINASAREISSKIMNYASNRSYVLEHFNEFKARVHIAQLYRIREQIKIRHHAETLDRSKFNAEATQKVQQSIEQYTKEHRDWGYNDRDIEFSEKLLNQLRTGRIDPNVVVVDSTYPRYSGPLLFTLMSGRFQKTELLIKELLNQGADAELVLKRQSHGAFLNPGNTLILIVNGGVDILRNHLLPAMNKRGLQNSTSQQKLIKELILLNHEVRDYDRSGNTALHYAVRYGLFDVAALLIASGADVNARNDKGETPLFDAMRSYQGVLYRLLVNCGADATIKNLDDKVAADYMEYGQFIKSALDGNVQKLQAYLGKGYSPDAMIDSLGLTLLEHACEKNDLKMAELLLKNHANTEVKSCGYTPLACQVNSTLEPQKLQMFTLLLKYGANPNVNPRGYGGVYILDNLVRKTTYWGGSGREKQEETRLAFMKALLATGKARFQQPYAYKELFENSDKSIVNLYIQSVKKFDDDIPILPIAISYGASDEFVTKLIERGANVNVPVSSAYLSRRYSNFVSSKYKDQPIRTTGEVTALIVAAQYQRISTVRLLLQHDADKYWTNRQGKGVQNCATTEQIKALLQ